MLWLDAFFAVRPLVLIPAWSLFLLGSSVAAGSDVAWWRLLHLTGLLMATHLVNQIVDVETDRMNEKGFFLQRGIFQRRHYAVGAVLLVVLGLGHAALQRDAVGLLALGTAMGFAYSLPPLSLSRRPGWDLLANAVGYGGVTFLLGSGSGIQWPLDALRLSAAVLAVGAVFLHTTLLDREGDALDGKITTGVRLGERRTRLLATTLATLSLAAASISHAPYLLGACAVLAALAWRANSRRLCVWGTAAFAVVAALAFWWYAVFLVVLVLATQRYYRWRFDIAYPSF